jgi:hypothetical protein
MAMGRASVVAAGFALAGRVAADPAGSVHIAPGPDRFGRILLASVEPLEFSARGMELAAVALRVMRDTFFGTPGSVADALTVAFAAANAAIVAENRPRAMGRSERRICVGATGIALAGREIVVAQAAPSQVILVQDGQVYPFPELASWRGDFQPDAPPIESHPLGFAEDATPRIYESEAAPGDLIVLCATSVGRALARDEEAVVDLYGGGLLTADLEGSVDRLERLLTKHDIADAFAVVASISRLPRRSRLRAPLPPARRTAEPASLERNGGAPTESPARPSHAMAGETAELDPFDTASLRPPLFEAVRDWAADLAELLYAGRQRPPVHATRERALAAPGALSVSRYRESPGLPPEWRANLPRGPGMHVPARLLAVSLVLFLTLGGTGIAAVRQREREARAELALSAADTALRSAQENTGVAMSSVAEAERAVVAAREAGAADDALARRELELARVRDGVWNIQRLGDVVRLGALPRETTGPARLALAGQTLFVAADDLYEVDLKGTTLVALLSRGDRVGDADVGAIQHVSVDDGHPIASDGSATFARDKRGGWERQPLAVAEVGGLRQDTPLIAWGDAAYGLSWDGDIVRFELAAGGPVADVWADADDTPDLELTRDLAIDGRIHVLLEDGRTLTFSRGALVGTLSPFVAPALSGPSFLASAPFANAFYIVDRNGAIGQNSGRIVRVDAAGEAVQYLTPEPIAGDPASIAAATSLASADDLVVDEAAGTVYWVSAGELWRASLPRP